MIPLIPTFALLRILTVIKIRSEINIKYDLVIYNDKIIFIYLQKWLLFALTIKFF